MSSTRDVIGFAKSNGGVFTTYEAAALGMSQTILAKRVSDGIFVRVARGVFVLPGTATRPDLMLRVACRSLGAIVSHESAALIHGLQPIRELTPTVTVSHRSTNRFPGVVVHQSTDLLESHIVEIGALRLTSPPRTIVDLAKTTAPARLRRVIDGALAQGKVSLEELCALHESLARKGKVGVRKLRSILDVYDGPPPVTPSELEARLLDLIRRAGLPEPVREFRAPWLKPIDGRIDLAFLLQRLLIEGDSRRWHALFDAFEEDRRRDNAAQIAGWRVLRFTWRMIVDEPEMVIATIRSALETR